MTRRASQQTTYTKGELDPDLSERTDLAAYYDSLASAVNCLFHPQGGVSDRGGFALVSDADILAIGNERRLRRRIMPLAITADNLTATNGGSTTNLVDQDTTSLFTSNAVTSSRFEILQIDLRSERRVDFVDIVGFKAELAGFEEAIAVEYWDGSAYRTFGDAIGIPAAKAIRTTARTRRFGTMPGSATGVVARYLRVILRDAVGAGQITISHVRLWAETATVSPVRVREVARESGVTYQLVMTERNIDVFERQRYVASIPVAVAAQQVPHITFAGGFDTLILFNEQLDMPRIVRQGASGEWDVGAAPIDASTVPALPSAVVFSGDQDEIQDVSLAGVADGVSVVLVLGDLIAPAFTMTSNADNLKAAIVAALDALPGVAGTSADLKLEVTGAIVRVRFSGSNGNRAWPLLVAYALDGTVLAATSVVQPGLKASGKYFEATTGWPRCGVITSQRLMLAGFRGAPTSYRFSTNPNLWDFTSTGSPLTADKGFGGAIDVKDVEIIYDVHVGRALQLFTQNAEWVGESRTLDATQAINFTRATGHGLQRGVPVAFVDGSSLFMQKDGKTLREFLFSQEEGAYGAEPMSMLCPHLLTGVVDVTVRKARDVREGNILMCVNADGTAAVMTVLKKQAVVAGAPWSTDGSFRSAMVSIDHQLYVVCERDGDNWLEVWRPDIPLDWATHWTGTASATISGLGYLEGRADVWAIADDEIVGPLTVTGGQVTLDFEASDVWVGLAPPWVAQMQVLREKLANSQPFRGPGRIYEVELAVKNTGSMTIATNGVLHGEVPLIRYDGEMSRGGPLQTETGGAPGLPMMQRLYTGRVLMTGLLGWSDHPYVTLGRAVPAPVHVKMIRYEVSYRGDQ